TTTHTSFRDRADRPVSRGATQYSDGMNFATRGKNLMARFCYNERWAALQIRHDIVTRENPTPAPRLGYCLRDLIVKNARMLGPVHSIAQIAPRSCEGSS